MPSASAFEHDRRAVRVVGADEVHLVALHALEAHPDVGLDVLHDVADVERAVGVRQRRRDEQPACGPGRCQRGRADIGEDLECDRGKTANSSKRTPRREYRKPRRFSLKSNAFPQRSHDFHGATDGHHRGRRPGEPARAHRSQHRQGFRRRQGGQEDPRRRRRHRRRHPARLSREDAARDPEEADRASDLAALPGAGARHRRT